MPSPNLPVTNTDVATIYTTLAGKDLSAYCATADLIVTENLENKGLSPARLWQIELYLAAHFSYLSDGGEVTSEKAGDATDVYAKKVDMNFMLTWYGQTAVGLDTTGTLAAIGKTGPKAQFRLVGPSTSHRRGKGPVLPPTPWPGDSQNK